MTETNTATGRKAPTLRLAARIFSHTKLCSLHQHGLYITICELTSSESTVCKLAHRRISEADKTDNANCSCDPHVACYASPLCERVLQTLGWHLAAS